MVIQTRQMNPETTRPESKEKRRDEETKRRRDEETKRRRDAAGRTEKREEKENMRAESGLMSIEGIQGIGARCHPWDTVDEVDRKIIILDAGHGGHDPGAVARDGTKECDLALKYTRSIGNALMAQAGGVDVVYTHGGEGATLADRVELSNRLDASLFVSIHCNAAENPDAHGFEVFTSRGQTGADRVATLIYKLVHHEMPDQFRPRVDWSDGDVDREANFYVLKHTRARAVLIELGFMTNDYDLSLLKTDRVLEGFTKAVSHGIMISA